MKPACVLAGLVAFTSVLLGASPTSAQRAPSAPKPVTEAVRVNVVNVEVFVTGPHGRPVLDLKPEEFELREDGKVVPLTNFLAPAPSPAEAAPPPAPASTPGPARIQQPSDEARQRTLVVFVDDLNLTQRSRKPVLDKLRGFLAERTAEGYRVVILSYNRSLQQHTPLTSDPKVLAAALDTLEHTAYEGLMTRAQRDKLLRDMGRAAQESGRTADLERTGLSTQAQFFALEQEQLNRDLLGVLIKLVDSLAGVPGRKAVLYVSDGVPLEPGADVLGEAAALPNAEPTEVDLTGAATLRLRLLDVVHHANASRIAFYTINSGASSGRDVSADIATVPGTDTDATDFFNRDPSLTALTVGTGGLKLPNAEALPAMAADLDTAYSLGYSPDHFGDGRYHRLSVTLKRAGLSARYREGYLDKRPEERQKDATSAALFAGGNSNPLAATVKLGIPEKQGRSKLLLPLTVVVPARNLVLLENGTMHEGQVSVTIAAARAGGRRSELTRKTFPIRVPSQHVVAFLGGNVSFAFSLLLEPGEATISVSARDDVSQVESVVVTTVGAEPAKS